MSPVVVATAGWSVPAWYPEGVQPRERLRALAASLDGVEVDSSFYALPSASTVERWAELTPPGFTFAAKLHRALSRHAAPLDSLPRDLREGVEVTERGRIVLTDELQAELCARTLAVFEPLFASGRLTCLVLQLTPAFEPGSHDLEELEPVVQALAPVPVAIASCATATGSTARTATLGWYRDARRGLRVRRRTARSRADGGARGRRRDALRSRATCARSGATPRTA